MLYATHQRYGMLFGTLSLPIALKLGLITPVSRGTDLFSVALELYLVYRGAKFGAEFPDCDSYGGVVRNPKTGKAMRDENGDIRRNRGSIPAQKHPLIKYIFKAFNVHHRGKFSHDFVSESLCWLVIFFLLSYLGTKCLGLITSGNAFLTLLANLAPLILCWVMALSVIDLVDGLREVFKRGYRNYVGVHDFDVDMLRFRKAVLIMPFAVVVLFFGGYLTLDLLSLSQALKIAILLSNCLSLYILAIFSGVLSHLVADGMTVEGVNFAGLKINPMHYLDKLLGGGHFRTGGLANNKGAWEDICRVIVTVLLIIGIIYYFPKILI